MIFSTKIHTHGAEVQRRSHEARSHIRNFTGVIARLTREMTKERRCTFCNGLYRAKSAFGTRRCSYHPGAQSTAHARWKCDGCETGISFGAGCTSCDHTDVDDVNFAHHPYAVLPECVVHALAFDEHVNLTSVTGQHARSVIPTERAAEANAARKLRALQFRFGDTVAIQHGAFVIERFDQMVRPSDGALAFMRYKCYGSPSEDCVALTSIYDECAHAYGYPGISRDSDISALWEKQAYDQQPGLAERINRVDIAPRSQLTTALLTHALYDLETFPISPPIFIPIVVFLHVEFEYIEVTFAP